MTNFLEEVKNLREMTGAGFLDCKKALLENNNNIDASIDYLRKKGLSKASKKSSREAKEGGVGVFSSDKKIVLIKINSETDFAAKSDTFLDFVNKIGNIALSLEGQFELDEFLNTNYEGKKISEFFNEIISIIGENIVLNDIKFLDIKDLNFNYYVHNPYKSNIGKIISIVIFNSSNMDKNLTQFAKNLCMHIAASKPEALDIKFLNSETVLKEKNFQIENIKSSGKPDNIVEKILEGKMKKFYSESTLLNQQYVLDQEKTVKDIISELPKEYNFELIDYKLFMLS